MSAGRHDAMMAAAVGKWRDIAIRGGVPALAVSGKNCPCPRCGGRDRFRFSDMEGRGTYICTHCGAGDGIGLLKLVLGWDYAAAAKHVSEVVGTIERRPRRERTRDPDALRRMWQASRPIQAGDPVSTYLRGRGIDLAHFPADLRCLDVAPWPQMLALVRDDQGSAATIHRTFLAVDGHGKAPIETTRKLMPGRLPASVAVRLGPVSSQVGIAEGIETALAASLLHGMPVWAAINAQMLAKWVPPVEVDRVTVFGDTDGNFAGQSAAYTLAHRLAMMDDGRIDVDVRLPRVGDWADVLAADASPVEAFDVVAAMA